MLLREIEAISGVTSEDFIELWSTLHVRQQKEFQCGQCLATRPEQLKAKRASRACTGGATQTLFTLETPTGARISYRACIGNFYRDGWAYWLQMYRQYQGGLLPFPGTVSEQPAKVIEVFNIISLFEENIEKEKQARAAAKGKRGR